MRLPRLALVLLLLTAMVALFGWRFASDPNVRKAEQVTREAGRLFAEWRGQPELRAGMSDSAAEAGIASAFVGRRISLPRGEEVLFHGTTAAKVGKRNAAAVRLRIAGEPYLLLVVSPGGAIRPAEGPSSPFPGGALLSGEREGVAYVFWRKDALFYCLASDRELTRVFESVRRYFP